MKILKRIFEITIVQYIVIFLIPQLIIWITELTSQLSNKLLLWLPDLWLPRLFIFSIGLLFSLLIIILYLTHPKIIRSKYIFDKRYGIYRHKKSGGEYCYNGLHKKQPEEHPLQKTQEDFICHKCEKIYEDSKKDRFPMARG